MNSTANIGSVQHADAESFDVIIIGAGLSGIGAAVRLQRDCPDRTFAVLERRGADMDTLPATFWTFVTVVKDF